VRKGTLLACSLCLLLGSVAAATAMDTTIVLGREDRWQDFPQRDNLALTSGLWGTLDLVLQQNEYGGSPLTDLLLHFDRLPVADEQGHYQVSGEQPLLTDRSAALGQGSALFAGSSQGLKLLPSGQAMFAPGSWLQDFTIELWLNPALLEDGEEVFSWAGTRWVGQEAVAQGIRCTVESRTLSWSFDNFFTRPGGEKRQLSLKGITPLVPRDWHHHMVRFQCSTGLLEYLVDGVPEAVSYATEDGHQQSGILLAYVGESGPGTLVVGRRYTGFVDELRISRALVASPALERYGDRIGTAVSRPFDLGYTGTRIKGIQAVYRAPLDSYVAFYYRATDRADGDPGQAPWVQFQPGVPFADVRGRYLQLMVELYPDGARSSSPELSELRVVYEQDLPPAPPSGVRAVAGNGQVRLFWNTVNEEDVRGYLVYYGERPGNYHGEDSDRGVSPIDVGNTASITVTGLTNGKLYYFSVVAYDATDPPHRSMFSREISARPSALLP
jgi:hypothetical protein